jgi:hypothetical protein
MGRVPHPHQSPAAPREQGWDWADGHAFDDLLRHAGWDAAVTAHAWFDPGADPGNDPPHVKGAYRLPHHEVVDGQVRVVWRGVVAAMGVVNGARGGVDLPETDRRSVYDHLASHYRQFHEEPPAFSAHP